MKYESEIRRIILDHVDLTKPVEDLEANDSLQSIGMDSISFISVIIAIECEFEIEFPEDQLIMQEADTIKQLCGILESMMSN